MIPITANPTAKEPTGLKRWKFEHWRVTNLDGVEHHERLTCSAIAQNNFDAKRMAATYLKCEPGQLGTLGWEPVAGRHVYIAHRLNAKTKKGIKNNLARASRWVAWAARQGVNPHATWIAMASGKDAETPANRAMGMACDKEEIILCSEVWLCGGHEDPSKSTGMKDEREFADSIGVVVVNVTTDDGEPPQ